MKVFAFRCIKDNPAEFVQKHEENQRERYLTSAEIPRFFKALDELPQDYGDIFSMLLFTGARKSNVCEMRWDELNLDRMTWHIPQGKSKNKGSIMLPIVGPAIEIVQRRHDTYADCSEWVFPAPHNKTGHITEVRRPWWKLVKQAAIDGTLVTVVPDAFRQGRGALAMANASLPEIDMWTMVKRLELQKFAQTQDKRPDFLRYF